MSSDKSVNDLLQILNDSSPHADHVTEVERFIADMQIEHSDTEKVHASVIYWFYMKWKASGGGEEGILLNRWRFFTKFIKYFQRGRHRSVFYKIKKEKFLVSRAEKKLIKADFKSERKRAKWRNAQRKQRARLKLRKKETLGNTPD